MRCKKINKNNPTSYDGNLKNNSVFMGSVSMDCSVFVDSLHVHSYNTNFIAIFAPNEKLICFCKWLA